MSSGAREGLRGITRVQPQDFAWLLFVLVLIITTPETNYNQNILLVLIGAFQIAEPRIKLFAGRRGQIASILLKLILSYLLVGWTHGIESAYYSIFLIPVVSAATILELRGVILVTAIAVVGYFSFVPLYIHYSGIELPPGYLSLMCLRASFWAIAGFLVYQQAHAKRIEMERTREAAERLTESNRSLRRAEASLRRSERLAALGQLTAGLAHELRNPLGTIKASAEMLSKPSVKNRPAVMDEMSGYITSEVDRVNGLISSFLDFAKPLAIRPARADLRAVLEEVMREQTELAKSSGVTLRMAAGQEDMSFDFDRELVRVALTNLVQNAVQASAEGQEVTVRANVEEDEATIVVSDEGEGIQPQHRENIFNPFFTTKAKGVGLGLAIVAKVVDEHGGRISVQSEPGRGTRFTVMLPATHEEVESQI